MLIVGLTGGVATGKSTVSKILKEEGACPIDADQIARELVKPYTPAWNELKEAFGQEILREDGAIDRKRLAHQVFSNPQQREILNRILHPRIKEETARRAREIGQKDPEAIVVIDAALLVESGEFRSMDKLIVVTSTEAQQIERLRNRDGASPEQARKIISAQMAQEQKLEVADFIIPNEGSLEETKEKVKEVLQELKNLALRKKAR